MRRNEITPRNTTETGTSFPDSTDSTCRSPGSVSERCPFWSTSIGTGCPFWSTSIVNVRRSDVSITVYLKRFRLSNTGDLTSKFDVDPGKLDNGPINSSWCGLPSLVYGDHSLVWDLSLLGPVTRIYKEHTGPGEGPLLRQETSDRETRTLPTLSGFSRDFTETPVTG